MMKDLLAKLNVRSVLVLVLVFGGFGIAIVDKQLRDSFADLAKVGVGGYLGQMAPEK